MRQYWTSQSRTLFFCALIFLVGFRAYYGLRIFSEYDDACYYRFGAGVLGFSTQIEFVGHSCAPGQGLVWVPLFLIAKVISIFSLLNLDAVAQPLIGLFSYISFVFGVLFFSRVFQKNFNFYFSESHWGLLFSLSLPILFYVTHRTTLAHSTEFVFGAIFLWAYFRKRMFIMFLTSFGMVLTRYNDFPILLVGLARLAELKHWRISVKQLIPAVVGLGIAFTSLILIRGYNGITVYEFYNSFSIWSPMKILFGLNFGLLWTAPIWVASWILGMRYFFRLSIAGQVGVLWMIALFGLHCVWGGYGSSFGYRYLIGSYSVLPIIFGDLDESLNFRKSKKIIRCLLAVNGIWMTMIFWLFQMTPQTTLWPVANGSFDMPLLLINTIRGFLSPLQVLRPLALSPPVAVIYSLIFPTNSTFSKYVLVGPALWSLIFASAVAIAAICYFAFAAFRPRRVKKRLKND